jgi:hypothetical protein
MAGLDTGALFKQQGAIRALGTAVIAASPQLADVLDRHGLTLDPVTGEVVELQPFNAVMSKRGAQVGKNLERLEAEWDAKRTPARAWGPVVASRLTAEAWAYQRPAKKPTTLAEEAAMGDGAARGRIRPRDTAPPRAARAVGLMT